MENNELLKKESLWMNFRHLGIILSNLAIFFSCVTILIPVGNVLAFMGIAVGVLLMFAFTVISTILTVGIIWTTGVIPKMWSWLQNSNDKVMLISNLLKFVPFTAMLGAVFCFASSIILQFIKQDKRTGRIIAGYILGVVCLFICIIAFAGVIK